ncbi:MATE family efflux transporter [Williamsia sp. CHRR-6]|uniref:MATE family efflux transporter n=1 Tax=Williamsia sp. CHRR-6 TaxID=2835871 RepID=UPI001BD96055|nr:MATE family efflux transporter [Williamsia sp. CHRR-6]MBT0567858.1 MATE family efflux transporter [Williamsia sp. CHRR-6]
MSGASPPSTTRVLRLAASALVVLIAEPLYLLEDLAVVGRLGATPLAALGLGTLMLAVVSTQLTFLSYGTTARAARWFGQGDRRAAVAEGVAASWLALVVGSIIVVIIWLVAPTVTTALASDPAVADDATGWLRIAVVGVPLILLSMAGNGWMRGVQDTRRPIAYVVAGLGTGAVLCPALVFGWGPAPQLGLHGSAVANLVGQSITGALFAWRLNVEVRASGGGSTRHRPDLGVIRAQLVLARDLIARSLAFQVCFVSAAAVAARFGVAALAAHQVVLQLWNFLALTLDALAIAAQSLVGAALGASAPGVARFVARRVTALSVGLAVVLMAVLTVGREPLQRIFTSDRGVLDVIDTPWTFLVLMVPIAGVVFALDGVLLGSGDAPYLRTTTLLSAVVGFLPAIWLSLVFDWGLAGIWTGLCLFMVLRSGALLARMASGRWTETALAAVPRDRREPAE